MKYRKDFVTNSSSSSFVCEICGRAGIVYDGCLDEADMCECENGHIICQDETLVPIGTRTYEVPARMCPICSFEVYSEPDMCRCLLKENKVSKEKISEDIRKTIKGHRIITNGDIIMYLCTKLWLNTDQILDRWKEEFGSYNKLQEYLRR